MGIQTVRRVRSRSRPPLEVAFNCIYNSIYGYNYGGVWVRWDILPVPASKLYSYSFLTDVIIDDVPVLPSTYELTQAFLASADYKAWKQSFKYVSHTKNTAIISFPPKVDFSIITPEGSYNGSPRYSANYFTGIPYPCRNSGLSPVPVFGLDVIKALPAYASSVSFDSNRISNMVKNLTSDARLLGLKTFSLANFLLEFKQSLNLIDILKTKFLSLKDQNNNFLAYNFGIKPLISDVEAIIDILKNLNKHVDRWNDAASKQLRFNTHVTVLDKTFVLDNYVTTSTSGIESSIDGKLRVLIKGHAYFYPVLIPEFQVKHLLLSLTGFDKPGGIVWEAIPYSFLVDWVFHVGDVIKAYESSNHIIQIRGENFGYSIKTTGQFTSTIRLRDSLYPDIARGRAPFGGMVERVSEYTRTPVDNLYVASPFTHLEFTGTQSGSHLTLAASLLLQKKL